MNVLSVVERQLDLRGRVTRIENIHYQPAGSLDGLHSIARSTNMVTLIEHATGLVAPIMNHVIHLFNQLTEIVEITTPS